MIENKYRIVRLLGEGGMGAVFEGENTRIKRRVAIKVLHAAIAHDTAVARRFQQEAQAAGHIGNEHIIEVLDLGELPNGDHFMVMEYLDGETLSDRIRRLGRLSPEQCVPLFRQILEGLGAAHDSGILHRDLKPDNIFILNEKAGQKDFVKIIDFGISKFQPMAGEMKMTRTGTIMGTPYYMSPEQASGAREMNVQSDIYAIGVILYEALTGAVPFDAPTFNQLMFRIVLSEALPIEQLAPDINPAFATIVKKSMAREQTHRFEDCKQFIAALEGWEQSGVGVSVPPVAAGDVYLPDGTSGGAFGSTANRASVEFAATGIADASHFAATGGALSRTNQAWANTQATPPAQGAPTQKSKTPMFIGAALGGLAVLGIGGALLMGGGGPDEAVAAGAALPVDSVAAPPVQAAAPAPQPETATPEAAKPEPAPAKDEAKAAAAKADPEPEEEAEEEDTADQPSATPEPAAAPVQRAAPRVKRVAPRPKSPQKKSSTSTKRDFGY